MQVKGEGQTMITTVIFDIGNVLAKYDYRKYLRSLEFSEEDVDILAKHIFESPIWAERDRGGRTDEEYRLWFISEAPHLEEKINRVYATILDMIETFDYAEEWVKSVKAKGKKVYLLSNYSKESFEHDEERFGFAKHVDGRIISYEINKVKPEPEIYQALIDKYQIDPKEAVFLDDLQKNLDGFAKLGGHTILVTSYEDAVLKLKEFGI